MGLSSASLLGGWGQLKCSVEGFSDAEKCATAVNANNEPCSFCTIKDPNGGEDSGLCVDPAVAPNMEQLNPSIHCSSGSDSSSEDTIEAEEDEEEVNVGADYHDFKCSIKAFNDPKKCKHTKTDGGEENCEYCTVNGPYGVSGICVSPEHASALEGYNPDVKCDGEEDGDQEKRTSFEIKPKHVDGWGKLKCSLNFDDEDKCDVSTNEEGQPCSFCQVNDELSDDEYGVGLCVDPSLTSQMESMNSDMSCWNDTSSDSGEGWEFDDNYVSVAYYDFKCTIKAFVDPDMCAQTLIGREHCHYCTIDGEFGDKGLCVSADHAEEMQRIAGKSVKCEESISNETRASTSNSDGENDNDRSAVAAYA